MRCGCVALIVLATVLSMARYKNCCNALSWYIMECPNCHLYFPQLVYILA